MYQSIKWHQLLQWHNCLHSRLYLYQRKEMKGNEKRSHFEFPAKLNWVNLYYSTFTPLIPIAVQLKFPYQSISVSYLHTVNLLRSLTLHGLRPSHCLLKSAVYSVDRQMGLWSLVWSDLPRNWSLICEMERLCKVRVFFCVFGKAGECAWYSV
jgi:hypothetical protein